MHFISSRMSEYRV